MTRASSKKLHGDRSHARTTFMWMQHADTRPFGYLARYLARYPVALALAAALSAVQLATPVLAQQNRPAAQSADVPRNPAAGGETGARPKQAANENGLSLPAHSTTQEAVELAGPPIQLRVAH